MPKGVYKHGPRPDLSARNRVMSHIHGHSTRTHKSPTWQSWHAMFARCTRPSHRFYARYGGRGITICERWQSFENFLADMGERQTGTSLDRIDNGGNYEPGNCRWADASTQQRNRAAYGPRFEHDGRSLTLREWAEAAHMAHGTLYMRIKAGWPLAEALTTPVRRDNFARRRRALSPPQIDGEAK